MSQENAIDRQVLQIEKLKGRNFIFAVRLDGDEDEIEVSKKEAIWIIRSVKHSSHIGISVDGNFPQIYL